MSPRYDSSCFERREILLQNPSDWCCCDGGSAPPPLFPCCPHQRVVNLSFFGGLSHLCNDLLDSWTCGLCLRPLYVGQTISTPPSWAATGRSCTSKRSGCSYCISQLSSLEFLPWMLTAFIHSIPPAWLCFYHIYTQKEKHTIRLAVYPPRETYDRTLRTDLTCWDWIFAIGGGGLIITPQLIVLAAAYRVRRFDRSTA